MIHARSGVPYEIMGLMQGKVIGRSLVIMDSFALPVQGTETRVNAANEANEYMVEYISQSEKVCSFDPSKYGYWLTKRNRQEDWSMLLAGITPIPVMVAGFLASMSIHRSITRPIKILLSLLW